jgi:hypothetical protein
MSTINLKQIPALAGMTIILLFLIMRFNIYCQDKEPNKLIFHINGKDTTLSRELVDGGAKKFIIGTQWGSLPIVHDALLMNMQQKELRLL